MLGYIKRKIKHLKQTRPKLFYQGAHDGVATPKLNVSDSLQALEPRIMFDAAAVATGAEVATEDVAADQAEQAVDAENLEAPAANEEKSQTDALLESLAGIEPPTGKNELIFIDKSVEDYQTLISGINSSAEIVFIDGQSDGVQQIADVLQNRTDVSALHIISHGDAGQLNLGSTVLTQESMQGEHADELASIKSSLSESADILIYGCNFAEGESGKAAADMLAELTEADVAASEDLTGHASLDADWDLEVQTGAIEAEAAFTGGTIDMWVGTLAIAADPNATDADMADEIASGIEVVGGTETSDGDLRAIGTYQENDSGLGIGDGVYLTTGNETNIPGTGGAGDRVNVDNAGDDNDANHAILDAIANQDLNDVSTFSFNFTSSVDKLAVTYILGTEETAAFAPTYNDVFAVIVTDSGGTQSITDDVNSHFTANDWNATHVDTDPSIESNFRTDAITRVVTINGDGVTNNTVEFAIGDNTDSQYDSSAFVSYFGASLTLDADVDDSSGASGFDFDTSYAAGGSAVSIVDSDLAITNRDTTTSVQTAVITLRNPQTSDVLDASRVNTGQFTVNTSVANQITLTAIGTQSNANWEAALQAIEFSNSDTSPDSLADRNITIVLNDGDTDSSVAVATISVTDTQAPAVPTVTSIFTNNTQPVISGTFDASDSDSFTVSIDGTLYTLGGAAPQDSALTNVGNSWSVDLSISGQSLVDGNYNVLATSTDINGNASSDANAIDVTIDNTAPSAATVTISEDANDDGFVNAAELSGNLDIRVTLPGDAVAGDTVTITDGTTPVSVVLIAADITNGYVDMSYASPGEGNTVSLTATVTDAAGNVSPTSLADAATIDTTITAPTVTTLTTTNTTPTITGSFDDSETTITSVVIGADTYTVGDGNLIVVGGTWTLDIPGAMADGTYDVVVNVSDSAGNTTIDSTGVTELTIDTTAPDATVNTLTTNNTTPTITGTFDDSVAGNSLDSVIVDGNTYTDGDGNLIVTGNTW